VINLKKLCIFIIFAFLTFTVFNSLKNIYSINRFISKYGWNIDKKSVIIEETIIPKKFEGALLSYESMLKNAGFDINYFKGKTVKKYSFKLKNHIDKDAFIILTEAGEIFGRGF
jgi:hypothetical protein